MAVHAQGDVREARVLVILDPELVAAYARLDEAIREVIRIKAFNEDAEAAPLMLADWVVLAASQGYDAEGEAISQIAHIVNEDHMPWYRLIGLVRHAQLLIEQDLKDVEGEA